MSTRRQRIAITGASGLIGGALSSSLRADGHEVVQLVRHEPKGDHERPWDPATRELDPGVLSDVDTVVHLAGAGVGDRRWTPTYKMLIRTSRVHGTDLVARRVAEGAGPTRLVTASAVGYYGDRGDEVLTETSAPGCGYLAGVVRDWEAAAAPAVQAGVPVAHARTGIVLAASMFPGIALVTPLFQLFGDLGWIGTYRALIIPNISFALPLTIYTLVSFFRQLPWELEEAARVDGASAWQTFTRITLPMLAPYIITASLFRLLDSIQQFDIIYAMTQGGPGDRLMVFQVQAYLEFFQYTNVGRSAALLMILWLITNILSNIFIKNWLRLRARAHSHA